MSEMTQSERWMVLALVLVTGWLVYLLAPVLTPFAMAALLAYLGDPLADRLERAGLSRTLAVVVVFSVLLLMLALVLVVLIPMLGDQISRLAQQLPVFAQWAAEKLQPLVSTVLGDQENPLEPGNLVSMMTTHMKEASDIASTLLGSISKSSMAVLGWVMNLVLIPVVTFYMLRDWDRMVGLVHDMIPRQIEGTVVRLASESNTVLGAFVRGQFTVMLALGVIYTTGLWLVGIDLSLLIGMVAGLISFVPYLGTIVGIGAGVLAALFQFGDITHVIFVLVVFSIGQMLEGMVLTPLLVGDKIGLHPVAVIFAILAGGQLFGFLGILLALPVASVVMVLLRHANDLYRGSRLYGQPVMAGAAAPESGETPADDAGDGADIDDSDGADTNAGQDQDN